MDQGLFTDQEQHEVSAELLALFDEVEAFQMDYTQQQFYLRERMKLMNTLGQTELSDAAFTKLYQIGSKAGFYLRARSRFDLIPSEHPFPPL